MDHSENSGIDSVLSITYLLWILQNIILLFGGAFGEQLFGSVDNAFRVSLTMDLFVFLFLIILAPLKAISSQSDNRFALFLIMIGSLIFLVFSVLWRVKLGLLLTFIRDPLFQLIPSLNDPSLNGLDAINAIISAIQYSNIGLLIVSIGLFMNYDYIGNMRYLVLIYGIINVFFVFYVTLIILKILSAIFLIPFLLAVMGSSKEEF